MIYYSLVCNNASETTIELDNSKSDKNIFKLIIFVICYINNIFVIFII